jgi:hypothetical protein
MIAHTKLLHRFIGAALKNGIVQEAHPEGVKDTKSNILKMVLACGLMLETSGRSDLALQLYDSVRPVVDAVMHTELVDVSKLPLLALMVGVKLSQGQYYGKESVG